MLSDPLKLFIYINLGLEKWKFKWEILPMSKKLFSLEDRTSNFCPVKNTSFCSWRYGLFALDSASSLPSLKIQKKGEK